MSATPGKVVLERPPFVFTRGNLVANHLGDVDNQKAVEIYSKYFKKVVQVRSYFWRNYAWEYNLNLFSKRYPLY